MNVKCTIKIEKEEIFNESSFGSYLVDDNQNQLIIQSTKFNYKVKLWFTNRNRGEGFIIKGEELIEAIKNRMNNEQEN